MGPTRDAVRQASSTALLIPPPKKAKVCTVPSDSSTNADGSEISDSSFTDDNLRHYKRHYKNHKPREAQQGHADNDNENSILNFPVPPSFESYTSSPAFYKKGNDLEEIKGSRMILYAAYRLKDCDMRRMPDIIFTESGNDLQSLVDAHEKEHLKYAPHHKRAKIDTLNQVHESKLKPKVSVQKDTNQPCSINLNSNNQKSMKNRDATLASGKVNDNRVRENPISNSKTPKLAKKKIVPKALSEVRANKGQIRENSPLLTKKGRLFSWHSYFTGKILLTFRRTSKQEALDLPLTDKHQGPLGDILDNSSVDEGLNLPRTVASYSYFRPVLEKSLQVQQKVLTGYGGTPRRTGQNRQPRVRLMKSGVPNKPSWFQKIFGILRIRSGPMYKNSSWQFKTQKSTEFNTKKAVRNISEVDSENSDVDGNSSLLRKNHRDSKTILRERRQRLFEEAQEFYEDSVMAYQKSFKSKKVPDIVPDLNDEKSVPLAPAALILSSLANTSKPSTLNSFGRLSQINKLANYSSVSETALLPIMQARRSLPTMNVNPSTGIEVIEDKQQDGTVRGILKRPKN